MEEQKSVIVTYQYQLPEHIYELKLVNKAPDFMDALHEIENKCRNVLKYLEDPSDDLYEFAEQVKEIVSESGVWEIE